MTINAIFIAYPLVIIVLIADLVSRGRTSSEGVRKDEDNGSTIFMSVSFVVALVLLPFLTAVDAFGIQSAVLDWVGLALVIVGIGIRAWARITLGQFYSLKLKTTEKQPIVDQGLYARVRHPGYLGYLLMWAGLAIASLSGVAILLVIPMMCIAYGYRIRNEENMLLAALGTSYEEYRKRTKRLIPFIY